MQIGREVFDDLENSFFFVLFLLITDGWCIVVRKLPFKEAILVGSLPTLYFASSLLATFVCRLFVCRGCE
jgi:hypothetical protein